MNTVVDFFKPIVAAKMPQAQFFYGSLNQINVALEALQVGKGCVCMNNLLPFTLNFLPTGAQDFKHSVTIMLAVKSHPSWGQEKRNEAQRVTLAWVRLLPQWLEAAGAKIVGAASGSYFINMFDANLDGIYISFQLQLPDTWDYCIPEIPAIPSPEA